MKKAMCVFLLLFLAACGNSGDNTKQPTVYSDKKTVQMPMVHQHEIHECVTYCLNEMTLYGVELLSGQFHLYAYSDKDLESSVPIQFSASDIEVVRIYVQKDTIFYLISKNVDGADRLVLCEGNIQGEILSEVEIQSEYFDKYEYAYVQDMLVDENKHLYIIMRGGVLYENIICQDLDMESLYDATVTSYRAYDAYSFDDAGKEKWHLQILDHVALGNEKYTSIEEAEDDVICLYKQGNVNDIVQEIEASSGKKLSERILQDGEREMSDMQKMAEYGFYQEDILAYSSDEQGGVAILTNTGFYKITEELVEKDIVTIGIIGKTADYSEFERIIMEFNRTNRDYYVELVDYLSLCGGDYELAKQKYMLDFVNEQGPDIIASKELDQAVLKIKGIYVDLLSFLANDSGLKTGDIISQVIQCLSSDGSLFRICPAFQINTLVGKTSEVGIDIGWTSQQMKEYLESTPNGYSSVRGLYSVDQSAITALSAYNMGQFINTSTGSCDLDSEEFISIMELAKNCEQSGYISGTDAEVIANGDVTLIATNIYSVKNWQEWKAIFNDDIIAKGYPSTRKGNVLVEYGESLGINSFSHQKEGAWSFIKFYLQNSEYIGFSVLEEKFEKQLSQSMEQEYDSSGNLMVKGSVDLNQDGWSDIDILAASEEDVREIREIVDSVNIVADFSGEILRIIEEEAGAYFAGDKSKEEVVQLIGNRVDTYLQEQN